MAKISEFNLSDKNPVGMIVSSMLTEVQFQALNGTNWILADSRSVVGSAYATVTGNSNVPDLRGMVLRGKSHARNDGFENPDGDVALGTFQNHSFGQHSHGGGSHTHAQLSSGGGAPWGVPFGAGATTPSLSMISTSPSATGYLLRTSTPASTVISPEGGNETRMRNITVNYFIKINP